MIQIGISPSVGDGTTTVFTAASIPVNPILFVGRDKFVSGTDYTQVGVVFTITPAPISGQPLELFADGLFPSAAASSAVAQVRGYTTSELLASLRQRSFTSGASRDFTDPDLLRLLNELETTYLLRLIARRNTNYLVETVDLPVAAGAPNNLIPSVAMAGAVRAVTLLVGNIPYALIEMSLAQAVATNLTPLSTQFPVGYYFMGPFIVLWPTQSLSGTLRLHYHRRPSTIVPENKCVQITALPGGAPPGNYRVSFTSLPAGFAGSTLVDVISNSPNFYRWQTSQAIQAITASTMDLPGPQPAALAIGDWVAIAGTAPVVTDAPAEVIDALLEATAADMLKSKGSTESYQRMLEGLRRKEEDVGPLIQQRNTGAQRKISAFPDSAGWPWSGW